MINELLQREVGLQMSLSFFQQYLIERTNILAKAFIHWKMKSVLIIRPVHYVPFDY